MKKYIIILILLVIPATALCVDDSLTSTNDIGSTTLSTTSYQITGDYVETECKICGKTIGYYTNDSYFGYDDMIQYNSYRQSAVDLEGVSGLVCQDCYDKYNQQYREWGLSFFKNARAENEELIKRHEEERHLKEIQEKLEKIENLKKELEELKGLGKD